MVVDKLFEFIEDIERFCVNHRWSRFFNDWETGDEALDEYAMIYKNCCNDVDEEKDGKLNKNAKPTIMKEYVSNQTTNTFMRHGVEKYFHEYIIVVDDDWYTPCEFISEFGLEDSFGPEYVFEQVVIAVKSSIKWLKNQGYQPDENGDDEAYNLWEMIDFVGSLKENTMENKNQFFESLLQVEK